MKVFIVGASGYIGSSVAQALMQRGDTVSGLARSAETVAALEQRGIAPVAGALDDAGAIGAAAKTADVTI
ncbi:MAG: NmrA family NAD(P)-binding protein, partial [Pseudolabrys sp.]